MILALLVLVCVTLSGTFCDSGSTNAQPLKMTSADIITNTLAAAAAWRMHLGTIVLLLSFPLTHVPCSWERQKEKKKKREGSANGLASLLRHDNRLSHDYVTRRVVFVSLL